ncbi:uncharacterized protein [Nicotiana tomentosiformis]|uniref:uncharacterized protein n=1 Tax=Nicotiana tomentosiformis TaxID=4098 RepID=UPI00388C5158
MVVRALANQFVRLHILEPSQVGFVPNVDGLRDLILEEAQISRYSIHPNVKYEHQKPGGLIRRLEIPEWKFERITMDFVVGFPRTLKKYDAVWDIVEQLTKSANFISVVTSYSAERLA